MHSILLLSGDIDILANLKSYLRRDYRLFEAEELSDALRILSSMPVDAVFIDSILKEGDGMDALRRIGEAFPGIPRIFITLEKSVPNGRDAKALGAYGCLSRPLNEENVRFVAEKAVEKQALTRDLDYLKSRKTTGIQAFQRETAPSAEKGSNMYRTEVIGRLSRALTSLSDPDALLQHLCLALGDIFGATSILVFSKSTDTGRYEPSATSGIDRSLFKDIWFDIEHGLARWLNENSQILRRETVEFGMREGNYEISRDLQMLRAELIVPLQHQGEFLGFLSLGRRISGMSYGDDEIELLVAISVHAGVALRNAIEYRRISYSKVCSESILSNIRSGIIAIDPAGRITRINPFAQKLLGLDPRRVLNDDIQRAGSVMADILLRTLKSHSMYVHHEVRDPVSKATLSISTSLLKDDKGAIIGAIAFFTDLSEMKELQSRIEDLKRVEFWSELSARMAHEIRNPLTSIKTFTQLFGERHDEPEFRENFVQIVGKEIEKIESITDQLITYSRPFAGEVKPVEVNSLIDDAILTFGDILRTKRISVRKSRGPEVVRVKGNREMLRESFLRVLQNAMDFSKEGGEILVSTRVLTIADLKQKPQASVVSDTIPFDMSEHEDNSHFVEVEFKDTGVGISEENLSRVFTPFFSTKIKGMGLGLAIVEKTLQQHRGRLELESKAGSGTTVRLIIPAYREDERIP